MIHTMTVEIRGTMKVPSRTKPSLQSQRGSPKEYI